MSHLVSELELSARLGHKILIAGLAEAGKTATKRIFFLKQRAKDVDKLAATVNYERMSVVINNVPITIVDLGGQKVFLKRFLTVFSPFIFSNVKALIFLCDVSNKTTRNSSVEYFENCIEKLQMYSPNAKYYVMLHKNDLVAHLPNYESVHEQFKEQFQRTSPQKLSFFRSTIYKPETVIDSFGRIIELTLPELSRSDFVEGREIGQIEEYPEKFVALKQEQDPIKVTPTEPTQTVPADQSVTASSNQDPSLSNLQNLMKGSMKGNSSNVAVSPQTQQPAQSLAQDSGKVSNLQGLLKSSIKTGSDTVADQHYIPSSTEAISKKQEQTIHPKTALTKNEVIDLRQKHMVEFYGIQIDEAKEIVNLEFDDVFGLAVTSGIPIKLVLKVFLNFIPLIRSQPNINIENLDKNKFISIFTSFSNNVIKEEELFDYLIYSIENPNDSIADIQNRILLQVSSRYEKIVGKLQSAVPSKYVDASKEKEAKISDDQEKINKLLFKYSNLQLEHAQKLVKANYHETFDIALTSGVSFEETLDLLLSKMPLLREKGLNTDSLNNKRLLGLMTYYAKKELNTQDFYDSLIIAIIKPKISVDKIVSIYLAKLKKAKEADTKTQEPIEDLEEEFVSPENEQQYRINHLLQITNNLQLDDAIKLVEIGYDNLFTTAISQGYPLDVLIHILVKEIPKIKEEGFNVSTLTKERLLEIFEAHKQGIFEVDDIYNALTVSIIRPRESINDIAKHYRSKSQVRAVKMAEIEKMEKEIEPLQKLEGYGFKVEIENDNCKLTFYKSGQSVDTTTVPPSIALEELIYLLTYEINIPFEPRSLAINFTARQIQAAIKSALS
ncbi:MAG: hypothetical protein HeimC3_36580 [Candidatus Heimdallarchaeota archaeon LC_3]|nr:MAG: hypothetical protein HeimC3_36580 [Candidatus Heimdallarchaeota archaeon LC_3]